MTVIVPTDRGITLTSTGAIIDPNIGQDEWTANLQAILRFSKALPWVIGDLLNFGEQKWGEMYAQAIELTGLSYERLAQYKSVAHRVPYAERKEDVPWEVYRRTASLEPPQREEIVQGYIEGDLENTEEVREAVREIRQPDAVDELPPCPACGGKLRANRCTQCRLNFVGLAWWANDFMGEVLGMRQTGEVGKLLSALFKRQDDSEATIE